MSGQGLSLLESRLSEKRGDGVALDPASILQMIGVIVQVIQACANPTPKALQRRVLNRAKLATKIKDSEITWQEAFKRSDYCFDLAIKATEQELTLLIDDCK